ncbi:hypothetical protein BCR32DRAFT_280707 [Anaeromyces robustus]|uniref:Uncharacterized protein n=1 Tax=Anaeromyces robustus TaxID=1754192 RepID=A0A1Y1X3M7_9FUNG|nr:hypothetical protein BCR32DRAFT_280707 [Anaeromyces robustus]|eukprot:ORX80238.1 hypothetical protein BCR32DRAFT_280707 [Anaeromyces robustus]
MKNFSFISLSLLLLASYGYSLSEEIIDDVSSSLNLNYTASVQFINNAEKINNSFEDVYISSVTENFSFSKCKNECSKVNKKFISIEKDDKNVFTIENFNKFLKSHDVPSITMDSFLDKCIR